MITRSITLILILYMNVLLSNDIQMNKILILTLAMVLVASMAVAGISSNLLVLAKKSDSSGTGSDGGGSSRSSGNSRNSGDSGNGDNHDKGWLITISK